MKRKLSIFFALCISFVSHSAEIDESAISRLMIDRNHGVLIFIDLDKGHSSPIACHSSSSWQFVLDISDDLGKQIYSSLLALYASGREGLFAGEGNCNLYNGIETLRRVELKQ